MADRAETGALHDAAGAGTVTITVADLSFDMAAYHYAEGLKAIGMMYHAAKGTLNEHRIDLGDRTREYRRHTDQGHAPIGEWETDGHRLWDQEDVYRLEQQTVDDALAELRAAITIAIYHHWERNIPNQSAARFRKHTDLIADAIRENVPLHADVDALCFAANYLKHGNDGGWLEKLAARWPGRFGQHVQGQRSNPSWIRYLTLSDDDVSWLIEIARASEREIIRHGQPK